MPSEPTRTRVEASSLVERSLRFRNPCSFSQCPSATKLLQGSPPSLVEAFPSGARQSQFRPCPNLAAATGEAEDIDLLWTYCGLAVAGVISMELSVEEKIIFLNLLASFFFLS